VRGRDGRMENCIMRSFITFFFKYLAIKSRMRSAMHVERMGEMKGVYRILVLKSEEMKLLMRP
jgi:hypothetical protein